MALSGLLTNRIGRGDLSPGDHIYSWRTAYTYAHHGIYVGDEFVIHFTCGGQEIGTGTIVDRILEVSAPPSLKTPCEKCSGQNTRSGVLISCLDCFLSGGDLCRFRYSVTTAIFLAQARGGTCTRAVSDRPEDVIHRAMFLLEHGFGTYSAFKNNCEDFAMYCKTGLLTRANYNVGGSGQLASLFAGAGGVLSSMPMLLLRRNLAVVSLLGMAGNYCYDRYKSDLSMRKDVVRISVEDLVEQLADVQREV